MSDIIGIFGTYGAEEDCADGVMVSINSNTKTACALVRDVASDMFLHSGGVRSHTVLGTSAVGCAQECCGRRHAGVFYAKGCAHPLAWGHTGCNPKDFRFFNSQMFPRLMGESGERNMVGKFKGATRAMGGRRTYIAVGSGFLAGVNMDDLLFVGKKTISTDVALEKGEKERYSFVLASSPTALSAIGARFIRGVFAREMVVITREGITFERIA